MTREAALVKPNGRVVTNPTHNDFLTLTSKLHPPPGRFNQNPAQMGSSLDRVDLG